MPTVPTYGDNVVRQRPYPDARVTPSAPAEAFGGGRASEERITNAAVGLIDTGQQLYLHEKKKADDLATTDAYNKTLQLKNDLFWNPQSGAMTRRGKDAFGVVDEYGSKFDEAADQIQSSLSNNEQRDMYEKMRLHVKTELLDQLEKHTFQESKAYDDQTTEAGINAQRDNAVLNYNDPAAVAGSLNMQKALLVAHAQRNGLSEDSDAVKEKLSQVTSATHAAVMERMLFNGQLGLAQNYYKTLKTQAGDTNPITLPDERHLHQAFRAAEVDAERAKRLQDEQLAQAQHATQNQFLEKLQANALSARDVLQSNLDPFGSGSKEQFLQMLQKEGGRSDPAIVNDLFRRIHLPDDDPNKLRDDNAINALFGKGLNEKDLNFLRKEFQRPYEEGEKGLYDVAEQALVKKNPFMGIQDPDGEAQLLAFRQYAQKEIEAKKKAGESISPLLQQGNKDWLGNAIPRFQRSPQEIIKSMSRFSGASSTPTPVPETSPLGVAPLTVPATQASPTPLAPPARKEGETPSDYLKRMKKGKG
jgi:hypothetical protein